jgi:hypothetical protein
MRAGKVSVSVLGNRSRPTESATLSEGRSACAYPWQQVAEHLDPVVQDLEPLAKHRGPLAENPESLAEHREPFTTTQKPHAKNLDRVA